MRYPVDLEPDGDTVLVGSPDFPEMHTFGDDVTDALRHAVAAIETAIIGRMIDREPIPEPSRIRRHSVVLPMQSALKVELYRAMQDEGVRKADLARRLGWHAPQVDRLLDLRHASRLEQLEMAFKALGREIDFEVSKAA
ncbi:MAG: type II toxin-antitoxin system HicB family antitoxin [Propylenella sp.]